MSGSIVPVVPAEADWKSASALLYRGSDVTFRAFTANEM
jgi:hypothetical protein